MLKASAKLNYRGPRELDLTEEMREGALVIAEEIRGNIKRGTNPTEQISHKLNAPKYAERKVKKLGQSKPLVAFFEALIEKSSYVIQELGRNNVVLRLSNAAHPKAKATISQIGSWNHYGTNKIPPRPFFEVSDIAAKRVRAKLADKISRLIHGAK